MEVHPPDHPIRSVRDFLLHLFTITVGLLIALGLEGLVEMAHNRHLLHAAENDLHAEMHENRTSLAGDERQMDGSERELNNNIKLLMALKAHQATTEPLDFQWQWNGLQEAAWTTARDTGALALMPYEDAQAYSMIYRQQTMVDEEATAYIHEIYRSAAPMQGGRKLADLQPADIDAMIAASQQAIVDLKYLRDLCHSLDVIYSHAQGKL